MFTGIIEATGKLTELTQNIKTIIDVETTYNNLQQLTKCWYKKYLVHQLCPLYCWLIHHQFYTNNLIS